MKTFIIGIFMPSNYHIITIKNPFFSQLSSYIIYTHFDLSIEYFVQYKHFTQRKKDSLFLNIFNTNKPRHYQKIFTLISYLSPSFCSSFKLPILRISAS